MGAGTRHVAGLAALAVGFACGPAWAWSGEVAWPTFYRAGPGRAYVVLDELDRGHRVEVLSCADAWCRIQEGRSVGFVEQAALLATAASPARAAPLPGCFESRAEGYAGGEVYRYCPR